MKKKYKNVTVVIEDTKNGFDADELAETIIDLSSKRLNIWAVIETLRDVGENEAICRLSGAINGVLYEFIRDNN